MKTYSDVKRITRTASNSQNCPKEQKFKHLNIKNKIKHVRFNLNQNKTCSIQFELKLNMFDLV